MSIPVRSFKQLGHEMRRGAGSGARIVQRARLLLRARDQLLQGAHAHVRSHREDVGEKADLGHRLEVPDRVVGDLVVEAGIDGERIGRQQQRVAVGAGARDEGEADIAAGAAAVLDHDRLPQRVAQRLLDDARDDVVGSSRRKRHDQRHRPLGIGCRGTRRRQRRQTGDREQERRKAEKRRPADGDFEHERCPGFSRRAGQALTVPNRHGS